MKDKKYSMVKMRRYTQVQVEETDKISSSGEILKVRWNG